VSPEIESDSLLIDTNVFSRLSEGDPAYEPFRALTVNKFLFLSFVTVGEVLRGAYSRGWGERRLSALEAGLRAYGTLMGDIATARAYADLWARLKSAGRAMSDNDLWIAATALAQDPPLPVLTNDAGFDNAAAVSPLVVIRPTADSASVGEHS